MSGKSLPIVRWSRVKAVWMSYHQAIQKLHASIAPALPIAAAHIFPRASAPSSPSLAALPAGGMEEKVCVLLSFPKRLPAWRRTAPMKDDAVCKAERGGQWQPRGANPNAAGSSLCPAAGPCRGGGPKAARGSVRARAGENGGRVGPAAPEGGNAGGHCGRTGGVAVRSMLRSWAAGVRAPEGFMAAAAVHLDGALLFGSFFCSSSLSSVHLQGHVLAPLFMLLGALPLLMFSAAMDAQRCTIRLGKRPADLLDDLSAHPRIAGPAGQFLFFNAMNLLGLLTSLQAQVFSSSENQFGTEGRTDLGLQANTTGVG